jgi:flagellar M-ring protein FliF
MNFQDQLQNLVTSLAKLGWRRLVALGLIGVTVAAIVGFGGYYLSRPAYEILYAGLDRQDVSNIGSALTEAGIPFDVSADGAAVKVGYSDTARARMLLAEKGLPHSANSGYELYDKLGSLGLTSFMQDVTRVRAMEGELARTIQTMNGIRAARVHIVLPDEGSFRRAKQPPSASVMIRTDSIADNRTGQAIRHLVAAAVPGMTIDQVTVLNTDGTLLSSGGDSDEAAPAKMIALEKTVSKDIQDDIRKELTPYLGLHNFQISVAAKLNTDNRQTNETSYNPDSRVERSTRVVKENQTTQNSGGATPTSVNTALPQDTTKSSDGKTSNAENSKREEVTNYELSSKVTTTTSGGYSIDHMSIAILVNRSALMAGTGDGLNGKLSDIEALVASAAGLRKERGDTIKVLAVDFADAGHDLDPVPAPSFVDQLMRQSGTAINALTVLVVTALLVLFGIRPLTRALMPPEPEISTEMSDGLSLAPPGMLPALEGPSADFGPPMDPPAFEMPSDEPSLIEDVTNRPRRSPQRRLEQMVEFDEEQAAAILKQWVHERSAA